MPICPACRGQKKIQGMGSMGEIDCKTCKGTGLEPMMVEIITPVIKAPEQKVGVVQSLELLVETDESELANLSKPSSTVNSVEPEVSKSSETMAERLKRKYTKSAK